MSRPKLLRRIITHPKIKGFAPYGEQITDNDPVILFLEEYETIRLCDYELKNHAEAAALMKVSRPTVTRIYESARRKMAVALTEGRAVIIEGGKVLVDSIWRKCGTCNSLFNRIQDEYHSDHCPLCRKYPVHKTDKKELIFAIALTGDKESAAISEHFARCPWFALFNRQTKSLKFLRNKNKNLKENAGMEAVALMKDHEVNVVVSGEFGSKVIDILEDSKISIVMIQNSKFTLKNILNLIKT